MIEFDRLERGAWVNPDRLSKSEQARLAELVLERAPRDAIKRFVVAVSEVVDIWEKGNSERMPFATRLDHIKRVESDSRRLLGALRQFAGESFSLVAPHFDYLANTGNPSPPMALAPRFRHRRFAEVCNELVEHIEAVRQACEYARSRVRRDRTSQDSRNRGRLLVRWVAHAYAVQFGRLPGCGKSDWFPEFMRCLGEIAKHEGLIGNSLVAGVVDRMRGSHEYDAAS